MCWRDKSLMGCHFLATPLPRKELGSTSVLHYHIRKHTITARLRDFRLKNIGVTIFCFVFSHSSRFWLATMARIVFFFRFFSTYVPKLGLDLELSVP